MKEKERHAKLLGLVQTIAKAVDDLGDLIPDDEKIQTIRTEFYMLLAKFSRVMGNWCLEKFDESRVD